MSIFGQRSTEIQFQVVFQRAFYQHDLNWKYTDLSAISSLDTIVHDRIKMQSFPCALSVELNHRFTIQAKLEKYRLLNEGKNDGFSPKAFLRSIGIGLRYNIIEKNNARLYVGLHAQQSVLTKQYGFYVGSKDLPEMATYWSGIAMNIELGGIYYFGSSPFGLTANIAYDWRKLNLYKMESRGYKIDDISEIDNSYAVIKGCYVNAGVVVRIRKSKSSELDD